MKLELKTENENFSKSFSFVLSTIFKIALIIIFFVTPQATSAIFGTRLNVLSFEQSPIKTESCVPIGLKYLSETLLHLSCLIRDSHFCFVRAYGELAFLKGEFSSIGK